MKDADRTQQLLAVYSPVEQPSGQKILATDSEGLLGIPTKMVSSATAAGTNDIMNLRNQTLKAATRDGGVLARSFPDETGCARDSSPGTMGSLSKLQKMGLHEHFMSSDM